MLLHPLRKFRFVSHSFARRSAIGPWRDSNIICRLSRNDALTLLGLNDDYTLLQVKKAYRLKIKLLHPDLGTEQSCEKKTVDLNLAYEVACKELGKSQRKQYSKDVFDECPFNQEPNQTFVNPLLCDGINHMYWRQLQFLLQEAGKTRFEDEMLRNGISIPENAFVYLTDDQYENIMEQLLTIQEEPIDYTSLEAFRYFLADCLNRAERANR